MRQDSVNRNPSPIALFLMLCLLCTLACSDSMGSGSGGSGDGPKAQVPAEADLNTGLATYSTTCATCHGAAGHGTPKGNSLWDCESCKGSFDALQDRVLITMPENNPDACADGDGCARDTAAYILCEFNPDHAEGCTWTPPVTGPTVPASADLVSGQASYDAGCEFCHGVSGEGSLFGTDLTACQVCTGTFEAVQDTILLTMPKGNPGACTDADSCAENTAAYILCAFNPGLAQGCPP